MQHNTLIRVGAVLAGLGVMAGAFGSHALEGMVPPARLETWETAVRYHMVHALGLVLVGVMARSESGKGMRWASGLLLCGVIVFSGTLYALVLTDTAWLGAVTPIGGVSLIAGWLVLAVTAGRRPRGGDAGRITQIED